MKTNLQFLFLGCALAGILSFMGCGSEFVEACGPSNCGGVCVNTP